MLLTDYFNFTELDSHLNHSFLVSTRQVLGLSLSLLPLPHHLETKDKSHGEKKKLKRSTQKDFILGSEMSYLRHFVTVFGLKTFFGFSEIRVFIIITRRFEVLVNSVWGTGSNGGHWRGWRKGNECQAEWFLSQRVRNKVAPQSQKNKKGMNESVIPGWQSNNSS